MESQKPKIWTVEVFILLSFCVFVLLITGLVAVVAAPNTWDSMTYHLPRVMHWLSQHSLAFYTSGIPRQNSYFPCTEYFLLHLYVLAGDDRWFNVLQWMAGLGSAVAISVVVGYFGIGLAGQIFAALFFLTVPMAILQSTSTQTDLIISFWIMLGVVFMFRAMMKGRRWFDIVGVGVAWGLAFFTKGIAFLAIPFFLWLAVNVLKVERLRGLLKLGAIVGIVVLISSGWLVRYGQALHDPGKIEDASGLTMTDRSWPCLVSNLSKNLASECLVPFRPLVVGCAQAVEGIHRVIGMKVDDPRTTSGPINQMFLLSHVTDEDYAGNFWHVLLAGVCVIAVFFIRRPMSRRYASCFLLACLFFILIIKWQPWVNRFHLPLFALAASLAGIVLGRLRWVMVTLGAVLVIVSFPYLFKNHTRPLVGTDTIFSVPRERQYFWKRPDFIQSYEQAVSIIRQSGCREVGLVLGGDSWEYPLWALTREDKVTFVHIGIKNGAAVMPEGVSPCLVVKNGRDWPLNWGPVCSTAPVWRNGQMEIQKLQCKH